MAANRREWLDKIKIAASFVKVAGVEVTLLDCVCYFDKASGIDGVAQAVKDIGAEEVPRKLAKIAGFYENSAVRRLGYLLDLAGHSPQSKALEPLAARAKSFKPLDPALTPILETTAEAAEKNMKRHLTIHEPVEVDFLIPSAHLRWQAHTGPEVPEFAACSRPVDYSHQVFPLCSPLHDAAEQCKPLIFLERILILCNGRREATLLLDLRFFGYGAICGAGQSPKQFCFRHVMAALLPPRRPSAKPAKRPEDQDGGGKQIT